MEVKKTTTKNPTRRMGAKEFTELGLLHEVNRRILHPLGLALEVVEDDETGGVRFGQVWDCRDEEEGIAFDELDENKMELVSKMIGDRWKGRIKALGYWVQGE